MSKENDKGSIRLYKSTTSRLHEMKREDETLEDVLERIIPDGDLEEVSEATISLPADATLVEKLKIMAGANVSASDVVDQLIDEYQDND